MKVAYAGLFLAAVCGALAFWAEDASATGNCASGGFPLANSCKGESAVGTTTGGTVSGRCFYFTTRSTTPTCTTGGIVGTANQATWELDPGACITLYYWDVANGAVPPAVPNKVTLIVQYEGAINTKTYQTNGAEPASGTSYTFCATSDGNVGSAARSGSLFLALIAIKDNGNGLPGNTNYNVAASGAGSQDTSFDIGGIRARAFVSDITRSAYPAGSTFAYGAAGDESVTITSSFTPPFADANVETMFNNVLDEATLLVGQAGATVDVDSGSLAQDFVADSTFPQASGPYVGGATLAGNSVFGLKWTTWASAGHGATIVRVSDTFAYNSDEFNIDPRIVLDSDGAGTFGTADDQWVNKLGSSVGAVVSAFNRGEGDYTEGYAFNARDQQLTRAMTVAVEDAGAVTCNTGVSLTPSSGKFSTTFTVPTGGACTVANTDPGSPRYLRITNTDQNHVGVEDHTVSSLLYIDAHPQDSGTLVPDDHPTPDATETLTYFVRAGGGGADDSDHVRPFCKVETVRHDDYDTSGSAVAWNIKDPTTATRASGTGDSGSDGWTPVLADFLATTPLGTTWTQECTATHNGNTGTDTETFTISVEGGGGGDTHVGDPLKLFVTPLEAAPGGDVCFAASEAFLDGTARTGNAADTLVYVYDPSGDLIVNGAVTTELHDGIYVDCMTLGAEAEFGAWTAVVETSDPDTADPVTTSNTFLVGNTTASLIAASLQDHRDNSLEILGMSFNDLEFDGFLILLFWGIALLFFLARSRVFAAFVATLGLTEAVIPTIMPGSFLGYLFLLIIGVWLEAVAGEKIYEKWLNWKNGTKPNKDM